MARILGNFAMAGPKLKRQGAIKKQGGIQHDDAKGGHLPPSEPSSSSSPSSLPVNPIPTIAPTHTIQETHIIISTTTQLETPPAAHGNTIALATPSHGTFNTSVALQTSDTTPQSATIAPVNTISQESNVSINTASNSVEPLTVQNGPPATSSAVTGGPTHVESSKVKMGVIAPAIIVPLVAIFIAGLYFLRRWSRQQKLKARMESMASGSRVERSAPQTDHGGARQGRTTVVTEAGLNELARLREKVGRLEAIVRRERRRSGSSEGGAVLTNQADVGSELSEPPAYEPRRGIVVHEKPR